MARNMITTTSGLVVNLYEVKATDLKLDDFVVSACCTCRYAGQVRSTSHFYSTAQHMINLSLAVPKHLEKPALIHDLPEAIYQDRIAPIKHLTPEINELEDQLLEGLCERMGVNFDLMEELHWYDKSICLDEMPVVCTNVDTELLTKGHKPLGVPIIPLPPTIIESHYRQRLLEVFGAEVINALA